MTLESETKGKRRQREREREKEYFIGKGGEKLNNIYIYIYI